MGQLLSHMDVNTILKIVKIIVSRKEMVEKRQKDCAEAEAAY